MDELFQRAAKIELLILDVDGVLTDGRLYYGEQSEHFRAFHVRDGLGLKWLMDAGLEVAVISGRSSRSLMERMSSLGIERVYQGQSDKRLAFEALLSEFKLDSRAVAYLGDDVPDLPVMLRVGLAVAVADAHPLVQAKANWITTAAGGRGAVRELCELLLQSQGKLEAITEAYLNQNESFGGA